MEQLPFEELRHTGLLWYINRVALHPRGLALAIHFEDVDGEATGWSIVQSDDGLWAFTEDDDMEGMAKFDAFMKELEHVR